MGQIQSQLVPFGQSEDQGLEELGGASQLSLNVLTDATGSVRKRPAIMPWSLWPGAPVASPVVGMEVDSNGYVVFVNADRSIHAWIGPGNVVTLSDATAATRLDSDQRPVLCPTRSRMVIAGGGALQKWDGISALSARLGGSPPVATHVTWLAQRLVVNVRGITGQIQWSEQGDTPGNETWPALNFRELEARSDPCVGLYDSIGELIGLGTQTLEMLAPDPTVGVGFSPVRVLPNGAIAPYSLVKFEDNFAFLDDQKRFVALNGRGPATGPDASGIISSPSLTRVLKEIGDVTDAWGFRLNMGAWDALVWVLATTGRSFVYNLDAKAWSEWASWGPAGRLPLGITAHCYHSDLGLHLVGDTAGNINVLDTTSASDNGSPIVVDMVSGFLDRGQLNNKVNRQLNLTFRRGAGTLLGASPKAYLSWRDDTGPFGQPFELDLGTASDVDTTISLYSLGVYRTRQWRLTFSDNAPFTLVKAQESFEILEV